MCGGIDFTSNLHLDREAVPAGFETFNLTLKGLKGGHSGGEIHVGLGNANKLLVRFLAGHAEELTCVLLISTAAHCVTPSRVKPLRPLLSQLIKSTP